MSKKKQNQLTVAAVVAGLVAAGGMVSKAQIARADDNGDHKASSADGCNGKDGCGGKMDGKAKDSCKGKSHDKCSKDQCKGHHKGKAKMKKQEAKEAQGETKSEQEEHKSEEKKGE